MQFQQQILDSLRRIVKSLRVSSRAAERELGLTGAQLLVLQIVGKDGGKDRSLSINDLAERTHTHQSSVSTVVSRLEDAGLVERRASEADGRKIEVSPTALGRRVLSKATSLADELVHERLILAIGCLSASEQRELAGLLAKVISRAGIQGETPTFFFEEESK